MVATAACRIQRDESRYAAARGIDLEESSRLLLLVAVLDVYTLSGLARIGRIHHSAVLPVRVVHDFALELQSRIDVREAELDVGSLSRCQYVSRRGQQISLRL
jgi:hypothetical protein